MGKLKDGSISRRAFLRTGLSSVSVAGMFGILPRIPGGYLVPLGPTTAFAEEGASSGEVTYSFQVVAIDEIGLHVVDVSQEPDEDGNYPPVAGAVIIIHSTDDDTLEPLVCPPTGDDGKVIVSITPLVPLDDDGRPKDGEYKCNVAIEMTVPGSSMREFTTGGMLLTGASGYVLGTRPDTGTPYLLQATFNNQDILYANSEFTRSKNNSAPYQIEIRVKNLPKDQKTITLNFYKDGDASKTPLIPQMQKEASHRDGTWNYYYADFEAKYLLDGDGNCLPEGDVIVEVSLADGTTTDVRLSTITASAGSYTYTRPLQPLPAGNANIFDVKVSDGKLGFLSGANFSFCLPFVDITVYFSPFFLMLGLGINIFDFRPASWPKPDPQPTDDDIVYDPEPQPASSEPAWGITPSKVYERWHDKYNKMQEKWNQKKASKTQPFLDQNSQPASATRLFFVNVNVIFNFMGKYQWLGFDPDHKWNDLEDEKAQKEWEGTYCFSAGATVTGSYTQQFVSPIGPMFLCVAVQGSIITSYEGQYTRESFAQKDKDISINGMQTVPNSDITLCFGVSATLSLGWGIAGVVSIAISGGVNVNYLLMWQEEGWTGGSNPHRYLALNVHAEIVWQVLLLKGSASILSYSKVLKDNWPQDGASENVLTDMEAWEGASPRFLLTHADGRKRYTVVHSAEKQLSAADLAAAFEDLVVVTSDSLGLSHEATGTRHEDDALTAAPWASSKLHRDREPRFFVQEDGQIVVELVEAPGTNTLEVGMTAAEEELDDDISLITEGDFDEANVQDDVTLDTQDSDQLVDFYFGLSEPPMREYDYTYVDGKATGNYCGSGGIAGIAEHDGITTTADVNIFHDVFSDARMRTIEIAGELYLFRISSVNYDTDEAPLMRSRLTASKFDYESRTWSTSTVIEYGTSDPTLRRIALYDYDFDIVAAPQGQTWSDDIAACVVVISGTRPEGATPYDVLANQAISVILLDGDLNVKLHSSKRANSYLEKPINGLHALQMPRIVDGFAPGSASGALGIVLLDRVANQAQDLLTAAPYLVVGTCLISGRYISLSFKTDSSHMLDPSVHDMVVSAGSDDSGGLLRAVFRRETGYEAWSASIPNGSSFQDLSLVRNVVSDQTLPTIVGWPYHGSFLFVKTRDQIPAGNNDYHLYAGSFDSQDTQQTALTEERVDRAAIQASQFTVSPSGKFIFYIDQNSGDPLRDQLPDVELSSGSYAEGEVYRIKACALFDGAFSEDFTFCELDHPIDQFEFIAGDYHDACVFTTLQITDADNSLADVNYLAVSYSLSAEIEGFAPLDDFVIAGKPCRFQVDLRNHGNLIISGFDITMHDEASGYEQTTTVDIIEPDNILLTSASHNWAESLAAKATNELDDVIFADTTNDEVSLTRLSAEERDGWLMPGKTMSYSVSFDIPLEWSGTHDVTLAISNVKTVAYREEHGSAGYEELHHPGVGGSLSIYDTAVEGSAALYCPAERYPSEPGPNPEPMPSGDSSGSGGSTGIRTGATGTKAQVLPRTGDAFGTAEALGFLATGLGLLMAGYSARRTKIEREEAQERTNCEEG